MRHWRNIKRLSGASNGKPSAKSGSIHAVDLFLPKEIVVLAEQRNAATIGAMYTATRKY
jgi:hypothetical protein